MKTTQRNAVSFSGRETGRPIMFAHGFGCDQNMWRLLAPRYAERYRVVLFDHVGSGRSDLSAYDAAKYASLDGYAAHVLELPDAAERIGEWSEAAGLDLRRLGTTADADEIKDTAVTQPLVVAAALLAAGLASEALAQLQVWHNDVLAAVSVLRAAGGER